MHNSFVDSGLSISTAESCTSGFLAFLLTSQSGSSSYYLGGVNSYSNQVKIEVLGVPSAVIQSKGAVSEEVVKFMAAGVRKSIGSEVSIATTGIAGPTGGSENKPVGTVWVGLNISGSSLQKRFLIEGDRHSIRLQSSYKALEWLQNELG